jgi:hypothetical protein
MRDNRTSPNAKASPQTRSGVQRDNSIDFISWIPRSSRGMTEKEWVPQSGSGMTARGARWTKWMSFVLLASLLFAVADGQEKKKVTLPLATELKGSLAPRPMISSDNTKALVEHLRASIEKGRALYQAQERFDDSYRGFMKVVQFLQDKNQAALLCKSPEAARDYLAASKQLGEFQVLKLQYSAMLTSLRSVPKQTLTPARKNQLEQVLAYEKEVDALAPILDGLFSEQMRAEIDARGCKTEALQLTAKSKKGLVLPTSKTPTRPNTLPPAKPQDAPFSINNIDCGTPFVVFIDGEPLGTASSNQTTSFSTTLGAHSLCLAPANDPDICDDPSSNVESYIYDGWWIKAQCP